MMNQRKYYSHEAKMRARREKSLLIVLALSVGAGIGTVLALLFAPQEGETLRDDLSDMMEKRMGAIEGQMHEIRTRLEDRVSQLT